MLRHGLDFEQVIAQLARGNVVAAGNLQDVLQFLIERAAKALEVRRVSIWLFDETGGILTCLEAYDAGDSQNSKGEILLAKDYPSYFAALEKMRTIDAINAETDPRTLEMRETYLRRHRITTMLDAPIFLQGEVVGVVCHEHTGTRREWDESEKSFAGSIADFISVAFEATRRIDTERRLSETKHLLFSVAEQMSDGFSLLEPDFEQGKFWIHYVNPSGAAMYGYTPKELVGKSSSVLRVPGAEVDLFEKMQEAMNSDCKPILFEALTKHRNGSIIPIEVSLDCVECENRQMVSIVGRDISERKAAEQTRMESQAKSLQAQRLESLGILAGKIAHDFNNLLVGILGNVSLATHNLTDTEKVSRNLGNIESTANIAADLCNQLLIYSGKQKFNLVSFNLAELVEEMNRLLEVSLPENVNLRSETEENLPPVQAEPTQIRQLLLNLVTNAADAMADKGGYIKVATFACQFTADELANMIFDIQAPDFTSKTVNQKCVCLKVSDNGAGMEEATRQRIFEPFFTTKAKGRGLGMAALGGIIRAHGGAIKVESEPGSGTTVRVWLPAQNE